MEGQVEITSKCCLLIYLVLNLEHSCKYLFMIFCYIFIP